MKKKSAHLWQNIWSTCKSTYKKTNDFNEKNDNKSSNFLKRLRVCQPLLEQEIHPWWNTLLMSILLHQLLISIYLSIWTIWPLSKSLLVTKILLQNKRVGRVLLSMLSESHLGRVNVVCWTSKKNEFFLLPVSNPCASNKSQMTEN